MGRNALAVVAARIGDDPTTVLATYAHLLPHSDAEAAVTVAAVIAAPVGNSIGNGANTFLIRTD